MQMCSAEMSRWLLSWMGKNLILFPLAFKSFLDIWEKYLGVEVAAGSLCLACHAPGICDRFVFSRGGLLPSQHFLQEGGKPKSSCRIQPNYHVSVWTLWQNLQAGGWKKLSSKFGSSAEGLGAPHGMLLALHPAVPMERGSVIGSVVCFHSGEMLAMSCSLCLPFTAGKAFFAWKCDLLKEIVQKTCSSAKFRSIIQGLWGWKVHIRKMKSVCHVFTKAVYKVIPNFIFLCV